MDETNSDNAGLYVCIESFIYIYNMGGRTAPQRDYSRFNRTPIQDLLNDFEQSFHGKMKIL